MTTDIEFGPGDYVVAGVAFAEACAKLRDRFDGRTDTLEDMMIYVATELWDRDFSQAEIKMAFDEAVKQLVPYAAGDERRT